ncbi:uncharacterized protein LOC143302030 [Babylonia areolata]|uniref:uncharacterized protein LOC143302030 n=1 Tax=Babylonia areolata TaxID=304850 RepID=UPI003FD3E40B
MQQQLRRFEQRVSAFLPWDNEDNIVSKDVDTIINVLFSGVFLPMLFLVSSSTNVVNMVVFFRHGLGERINVCLFTLSALDLLSVTVAYGFNSDVLYMFLKGRAGSLGPAVVFFVRTFLVSLHAFIAASQVVSSVIALERCLCITRPLLVKRLLSARKTAVCLWTVVVAVVGGNFVADGLRLSVICIYDAQDGSKELQFFPSQFYLRNQHVVDVFAGIIYGLSLPLVCTVSVTVCTVITVVKMREISQWRETSASASGSVTARDLALTRMIVGTSTLFIVCIVPSVLFRASAFIVPELRLGGRYENLHAVFIRFYQLASVVNCSFNFFIYYSYGSRFRQSVRELFPRCRCLRDGRDKLGQRA